MSFFTCFILLSWEGVEMSRSKSEKIGNGGKCELSVWTRAITANSEWPDKVNITTFHLSMLSIFFPMISLISFDDLL